MISKQFEIEQRNQRATEYLRRKSVKKSMETDKRSARYEFWGRILITILAAVLFVGVLVVTW